MSPATLLPRLLVPPSWEPFDEVLPLELARPLLAAAEILLYFFLFEVSEAASLYSMNFGDMKTLGY